LTKNIQAFRKWFWKERGIVGVGVFSQGGGEFFSRERGVFLKGPGSGNVSLEKKSRTPHHTQNAKMDRTAPNSVPGYRG